MYAFLTTAIMTYCVFLRDSVKSSKNNLTCLCKAVEKRDPMGEVELQHVSKAFGTVKAVKDISLRISDKEFLTLLGPSGCGKTTILRMISGLETPTSGDILISGKKVNDLSPRDRDIAMVFQSYALYPHMSVYDNLAFPLKNKKKPKDEISKRVKETATLLGIDNYLNRKPKELSGGEQQRVALGRAIVRNPQVFLMDEPLSNLDAKLRVHMRTELIRLQKELATTLIYVTHDQLEAMTMSDRIAIIDAGKLVQLETPQGIYLKPANLFVAGFVGSPAMNLFDCSLVKKDGLAILDAGSFTYELDPELGKLAAEAATSDEVILGVRPADIALRLEKKQNGIPAEVYVVEPLGDQLLIDFKLGAGVYKAFGAADMRAKIGDKVFIEFNREKIHIFDKKTEKAIV
jgi:multiple sugar transport system ATP-binding protein